MASIGEQFKSAREARGLTVAQVAESTHIKPTHIAALERNEFSAFASPIYTRGFIKMYAECVDLDPQPLLDAYRVLAQPVPRPTLLADDSSPTATPPVSGLRPTGAVLRDLLAAGRARWRHINPAVFRQAGRTALIVLAALLALFAARSAFRSVRARKLREPRVEAQSLRTRGEEKDFPLLERPPAPYVDSDSFGRTENPAP